MEACSTAHFWARELAALGHEIRLMPAAYVKPYVKRSKSDALDAEGICEAVTRPTMRFVAIKSPEQQAALMLHRTRQRLVRQRTMLVNALRGHLAEYGIIAPQGLPSVPKLREVAEKARGAPCLTWHGDASACSSLRSRTSTAALVRSSRRSWPGIARVS